MIILKILKTNLLKTIALFILVLISNVLQAQTIEEVLRITLKTSPELLQKAATKHKQEHNLQGTLGGYLPQVDLANAYGSEKSLNETTRTETGTTTTNPFGVSTTTPGGSITLVRKENSIVLNQMLFDGFLVKNEVEASAARLKSTVHDVYTTTENVILRTIEAYLEVLRLRLNVKFAKENLANHQGIYQQIQLRSEGGIGKKVDLDQATARLALARTNLMEQQATLRDAESNFRRITGVAADVLIRPEVSAEALPITEDTAVALALQNHPDLQKAAADILAAKADKQKAKAAYYPTLSLQVAGTANKNIDGNTDDPTNFSVMLKLNYNMFRGGKDIAQEHAAAWALEESKEALSQVRRQVEQSMRISWNAYTNSRAQLQYRKEHAEAIQKTRDAYRDQFSIGQRTLLDLLDSENELFSANTAYISSQYVELLGKYRVLGSMGKLMTYFKIPIPEAATYTPRKWVDGF